MQSPEEFVDDTDSDETRRQFGRRSLVTKFGCAWQGVRQAFRDESNFFVHLFAAALVGAASVVLRIDRVEACLVILCVVAILAAEMFNTSVERLAKAIDSQENEHLKHALDISSGAVLMASMGAAAVGLIIFIRRLVELLG